MLLLSFYQGHADCLHKIHLMRKPTVRFRQKQRMQIRMHYNLSTMPNSRPLRQHYNTKRMLLP